LEETNKDNPAEPRKRIKRKKPMSKSSLIFLVFWVSIIGLSFILVVNQAGTYNELRADLERLNEEIDTLSTINEELYRQIIFFDSDDYIEQRAREWLGMVRPNEIVFRNIAALE